jgi:Calcineurin-like phosphoesterase
MNRFVRATLLAFCLAATAAAQAPVRGPYLQLATDHSIRVRWRSAGPSVGQVRYGPAPDQLTNVKSEFFAITDHEFVLTDLVPATRYYYGIYAAGQLIAGGDVDHFFVTHPAPGTPSSSRFWVLGDSGTANSDAQRVRDGYYQFTGSRHTDAWLMLGDNAYVDGTDLEYQTAVFQNAYEAMLRKSVLWPTMGNHDGHSANALLGTGPYYQIFSLPKNGEAGGVASGKEAYYSFDFGDVHFICLESYEHDRAPSGAMATWLANDLAMNSRRFNVAYWHHPPYSKGTHNSDTELNLIEMRQFICPILEAGGVDLVLCGHSHGYERTALIDGHYLLSSTFGAPNQIDAGDGQFDGDGVYRKDSLVPTAHQGTVYVVCGCSGKQGNGTYDHAAMIKSVKMLGSFVIDVNGDQLDARFLDDAGAPFDSFTIVKGGQSPVALHDVAFDAGGVWRYHDLGVALSPEWKDTNYDDSSWASGAAPLGYGDSFIVTTVSYGADAANKHPTTYFRRAFTLAESLAGIESLRLATNYDDGVVIYLDGVEIARRKLPAGPIAYSTKATDHEGGKLEAIDVSAHSALFTAGAHVLAVELHQASASSSDLAFDLRLDYDRFESYLSPCAAGDIGDDVLRVNGSAGSFARSVDVEMDAGFELAIDPPAAAPVPFVLFLQLGPQATPSTSGTLGSLCITPQWIVANSLLPIGPALIPSHRAPWSVTIPPLRAPLEFTLQAVFPAAAGYSKSNALHVRVIDR